MPGWALAGGVGLPASGRQWCSTTFWKEEVTRSPPRRRPVLRTDQGTHRCRGLSQGGPKPGVSLDRGAGRTSAEDLPSAGGTPRKDQGCPQAEPKHSSLSRSSSSLHRRPWIRGGGGCGWGESCPGGGKSGRSLPGTPKSPKGRKPAGRRWFSGWEAGPAPAN